MWPKQSECREFYGNPVNKRDPSKVAPQWEAQNLVVVASPWRMVTSWRDEKGVRRPVKGVRVHRKCAESLARVFAAIWQASGQDQAKIEQWGCHLLGGGFTYRAKRGGSSLSMHAYGCAIDLDPDRNGMGDTTPNFANIREVLNAFASEGWEWGGDWSSPDGMHWQAART